jgi:hypothetical protein
MSMPHVHVDASFLPRSALRKPLLSVPHPQLTHALQQVHIIWSKRECYYPDDTVTIHPDDNNNVIIQPDEFNKCYHPAI